MTLLGEGEGGDKFYVIFLIYFSLVPHLYTSLLQGPPSPSPENKMVISLNNNSNNNNNNNMMMINDKTIITLQM